MVPRRDAQPRLAAVADHYPQVAFPYERLVEENRRRSRQEPEFELLDTGVFDDRGYWIVEADRPVGAPPCSPPAGEAHRRTGGQG